MAQTVFGYNPRQLNLMAIRIQRTLAEHFPSLTEKLIRLNVAPEDDETLDMPVQTMSSEVLVVLFLSLLSANNAALTEQLQSLGLQPPPAPEIQPIDLS